MMMIVVSAVRAVCSYSFIHCLVFCFHFNGVNGVNDHNNDNNREYKYIFINESTTGMVIFIDQ